MKIGGYEITVPFSLPDITTLDSFMTKVIEVFDYLIPLSVVIAVGMIIFAGITYMTSTGEEEKIRKASGTLTAAVIGLVIVFGVRVILEFIIETFLF
jgi:hypothetical protein